MPFNFQTFRTRTLTALIFVMVMLAGLFVNQWTFLVLFVFIHMGCWLEYQRLIEKIDLKVRFLDIATQKLGVIFIGVGLMMWMVTPGVFVWKGVDLQQIGKWQFVLVLTMEILIQLIYYKRFSLARFKYTVLGFLYISASCGLMIDLYCKGATSIFGIGWCIPLVLIASIWINDTMAYIVGSLIGKTPFSAISPNKTWEGTIGGVILAVIAVVSAGWFVLGKISGELAGFVAIAAIAGTAGDLLESKLKRLAHVKDSGTLMPGHGGYMDRFDSLLIAIPFVWLFLKVIDIF